MIHRLRIVCGGMSHELGTFAVKPVRNLGNQKGLGCLQWAWGAGYWLAVRSGKPVGEVVEMG